MLLIIGYNPTQGHPMVGRHIIKARERGAKLIVVDPRKTEIADKADIYLQVPVGYNIPLINGIIHVIIQENLYDREFVQNHVEGFEDLARSVEEYTPACVEKLTGIPQKELVEAARLYARAKAAAIFWGMGVTQFTCGTANVVTLSNLAVITGNLGRPGAGLCPVRGQNNVQGGCDVGGLPNVLTGYLPVASEANRARFEKEWKVRLSPKPGLVKTKIPDAILRGEIRALEVMAENTILTDPDTNHMIHALENIELFVIHELFLTETARLAHVVFPAACWAEEVGTQVNTERRVQLLRKLVDPPGEARPNWWIFGALARKMGYQGMNYSSSREIWDEIRRLVPEMFGGISYARLEQEKGIQWPCPAEDHPGTPILHVGAKFATPSGKAVLRPVFFDSARLREEALREFPNALLATLGELPDQEYPFSLITVRRVYHYNARAMTGRSWPLNVVAPHELIEINAGDAAELGIQDGDMIKLSTRRGYVAARAWVTERVPRRTVIISYHFWEASGNELTTTASDPITGTPQYKLAAVKVEKISDQEAQAIREEKRRKFKPEIEREAVAALKTKTKATGTQRFD